jgi:hypothetical protein
MSRPRIWLCASLSSKQAALTLPQTTTVAPLVGLAEAITAGQLEQECIAPSARVQTKKFATIMQAVTTRW